MPLKYDADVIVIGSGFGGSVCAFRAAEAGLRTLVLERGPRVDAALFDAISTGRSPIFHRRGIPGIVELHLRSGLIAVTGGGIGGGSNVYTAVTVPMRAEAFTDAWPAPLRAGPLAAHYEKVAGILRPSPLALSTPRAQAMQAVAPQLGATYVRLPLTIEENANANEQPDVPAMEGMRRELAVWLHGGRATRKRTLAETYLARAEHCGASVLALHEARRCVPIEGGYRIHARHLAEGGAWIETQFTARRVVLSAGTLNTLRLLLRWRDVDRTLPGLSSRLGHNFYQNGDSAGLLIGPRTPLSRDAGPPVTGWLDFWTSDRLFLMDCGVWPTAGGIGSGGSRYGLSWAIGIMGFDETPGRLQLSRRGRLVHRFDAAAAQNFSDRRSRRLRELAEAVGARLLVPPASLMRRFPATVHPLGGAAAAERASDGVVAATGEAFGHAGLFVADGSVLPGPTGVAPSMTIAAVAEHIAGHLVASCRS